MICLPLSAKVALWSFLVAGLTMGSAMLVTTLAIERELMAPVHQRLEQKAKEIFSHLDRQAGGSASGIPQITKDSLPPSVGTMPLEILGPNGELLYRSAGLKNKLTLTGGPRSPHTVLLFKSPFHVETFQQGALTLLLGYPLSSTYTTLERVKTAGLYALPAVVLLSLLGGYWIAGRALKPVRAIIEAAKSINADDLHRRLPVPKARDDIRELTNVLNGTIERLERSYLQAMRFASDASHQLKTPVTVLRAAIEELLRDPTLKEGHAVILNDLLEQTRRLASLSEGLLLLAQADAGRISTKPREIDLVPIIHRCLEDAEILASNMDIRIDTDLPDRLPAVADPERTEQILLNLLDNAVKYNVPRGSIRLRAGTGKDAVFIAIANSGNSIPPERVPWIFDRFARGQTDESRAGHGLGLAIARDLAVAQGGDVRLIHSGTGWTEFELRLAAPTAQNPDGGILPLLTPPPTRALIGNPG